MDSKFEELLLERKRRLDDLVQARRDGLPSAELTQLEMRSDEAWARHGRWLKNTA
jgi:hypothetical protein